MLCINGEPPERWGIDRWAQAVLSAASGAIVLETGWTSWGDLLAPLSGEERNELIRRSRSSRPGPSNWKLAFLVLFPEWAQEAYWLLVDTQRACATVVRGAKRAIQANIPKPTGGVRPITMLEETFMAIDEPVARRKARRRRL